MVEEMCAHELGSEINGLVKVVPTIKSLIEPVMDKAYQL